MASGCIKKCEYNGKMFRIPPDPTRRAKWFEALNIEPSPKVNLYVCAKHFSSNQIHETKLRVDAVPDTCLGDNSPTKLELKATIRELMEKLAKQQLLIVQQQEALAKHERVLKRHELTLESEPVVYKQTVARLKKNVLKRPIDGAEPPSLCLKKFNTDHSGATQDVYTGVNNLIKQHSNFKNIFHVPQT